MHLSVKHNKQLINQDYVILKTMDPETHTNNGLTSKASFTYYFITNPATRNKSWSMPE